MTSYLAGTAWTKDGKSCQSCHMSLVERKLVTEKSLKMKFLIGVQPVRMHDFRGARRGDIVAGCADVAVAFDGDKVVASVTTKTGHQLPCTTHREVVLKVTQYGADGSELASSVTSYSFPDGPSLPPGGPTTVEVRAAPGARKARATLIQILEKTEGRPDRIIQEINDAETTR